MRNATTRVLTIVVAVLLCLVPAAIASAHKTTTHHHPKKTAHHHKKAGARHHKKAGARHHKKAHARHHKSAKARHSTKRTARRRRHHKARRHHARHHRIRAHLRVTKKTHRPHPRLHKTHRKTTVKKTNPTAPTTTGGSGASGGSTPFFDGTFANPDMWPMVYGSCVQTVNNTMVDFDITSSCDPAGDGHSRTDLCSSRGCAGNGSVAAGDVYQSGSPTCTSVPVDATDVPTVPNSSWMMFAEDKDDSATTAGWAFMLNSYYTGANQFQISFGTGINNTTWDGPITAGWHTLSICTNNANNSSGVVYGIYEDGNQLTFNHGSGAGQQSISGFPIINNGESSWPLDVDDYTGGSVPNTISTGAPLVSAGSSNPPMPAGGWNNP